LLAWAAQEKADLDHKRHNVEYATAKFTVTAQQVNGLLTAITAELAALETVIASLPEGPAMDDNINKKVRAEYKKFLLENRKESYGTVALLEKEMDLGRVPQEIAEVDVFIAAVEAQKATRPEQMV
jgi:hypothetical protein